MPADSRFLIPDSWRKIHALDQMKASAVMQRMIVRLAIAVVFLVCGGRPAAAQIDLSGMWAPIFHEDQVERVPGPEVGDYSGLPINDAMRLRADSWQASLLTLPEHQCKPHPSTYGFRGVGNLRISADVDDKTQAVLKLRTHIQWQEQKREIWMDGRPHPPEYAAHTWQGFSTGHWEGNTLVVETTHLKAGWIRRNGLALSDRATMTERFIRHGNYLTHVYEIQDPVYLTEPLIKTNGFQLTANPVMQPYPCYPTVEVPREKGDVPHYLPGANPFIGDFAKKYKLPQDEVRGGAETALPESVKAGFKHPGPIASPPNPVATPDNEVHSLFVQGNVWMLVGGGVNAAVQIGDDGVLVVDTLTGALADKTLAEIRKIAGDKPIRWIINTHAHPDHVGGNQKIAEAGHSIVAGNFAGQASPGQGNRAAIIAHENVDAKLQQAQPPMPFSAMPTETFFTNEFEIFFNGEAVQMLHVPNAHTDGDVMVFFRKSDVIVSGDIYRTTTFPMLDATGNLNALIGGLNQIIDLTIPKDKQEGGTYVIPGHGRLTDEADVVEYRDMMTIIRDRIDDAVHKGMSLEQVKAARLTRDYDGRYGASQGPWTTDQFIEAAYKSLKETPKTTRREQ
jgi:glyoxylase-like metal-dependent hydrolase (beta-lactamase superfamily II)